MDDKLLQRRIIDALHSAEEKHRTSFFGFCDVKEQKQISDIIRTLNFRNAVFWGGYQEAERKCVGFFPGEPQINDIPVVFVKISTDKFSSLTHRDYMGSLLGMGIKREILGDIILNDIHSAYAAIYDEKGMVEYIVSDLEKIAHATVECEIMKNNFIPNARREYENIKFTVSSMRLDCVIAGSVCVSRTESQDMINGSLVTLNYEICTRADTLLKEGDVFSVRAKGKFVVCEPGGITKKEKIRMQIKKYL